MTEIVTNMCSLMKENCSYVARPNQSEEECGVFKYLKGFSEGPSRNNEKARLAKLDSKELEKKCLQGLNYD